MSVELLNVDCMEYMRGLRDKSFDLAIVDPPYGIGEKLTRTDSKLNKYKSVTIKKSKEFNDVPTEEYFNELNRICKNVIIWGGNYFNLPPCRCFVIWDKLTGIDNISHAEYAWTSFDEPSKIFRHNNQGFLMEEKIHPTQKPIVLYAWLMRKYAKEGDRILDTHLGSASSAIAAKKLGFYFVGCEIDNDYYNDAVKRYKKEIAMPLFD